MKCEKCGETKFWKVNAILYTEYHDAMCRVRLKAMGGILRLDKVVHDGSWYVEGFSIQCEQCNGIVTMDEGEFETLFEMLENGCMFGKLKVRNRRELLEASREIERIIVKGGRCNGSGVACRNAQETK